MPLTIAIAEDMEALGTRLAHAIQEGGLVLYLSGELGTGKTTLVRGFLRGLGYQDRVKSPTYTLVEPYFIDGRHIYHFDLYRIKQPEELEAIGVRDYYDDANLCLFEWPEYAPEFIPPADIVVTITHTGTSRKVAISPPTEKGCAVLTKSKLVI